MIKKVQNPIVLTLQKKRISCSVPACCETCITLLVNLLRDCAWEVTFPILQVSQVSPRVIWTWKSSKSSSHAISACHRCCWNFATPRGAELPVVQWNWWSSGFGGQWPVFCSKTWFFMGDRGMTSHLKLLGTLKVARLIWVNIWPCYNWRVGICWNTEIMSSSSVCPGPEAKILTQAARQTEFHSMEASECFQAVLVT